MVEIMIREERKKRIRRRRFKKLDWGEKAILVAIIAILLAILFSYVSMPKILKGPEKAKAKISAEIDAIEKAEVAKKKVTKSAPIPNPPIGDNGGG